MWLTDVPLRLQITHRDSRRSQKKKKFTRKLERKRLLMGHYKFMSRDNSLKTACVSLTFLELVQKKSIPYFELWPFVLSNRGYAWLLHLPFAQQTLLFFNSFFVLFCFCFWKGNLLVFVLVKFGIRRSIQCTAAFIGFRRYAPALRLHSHLSSAMDSLTTVFCL